MDPALHELVLRSKTDSYGDDFSHLTEFGPKAKWLIGSNNMGSLYKEYSAFVYHRPQGTYCLSERV